MAKGKSKKVKKFRSVDINKLVDSANNSASTSSSDTSGTLGQQKNDYKGGKESPHIEEERIALTEVATSDAMEALPETMAGEISHSSETTSESKNDFMQKNNESDVTNSKTSSRDNNYKTKRGKNYVKHNDFNHALPNQLDIEEEKSNQRSCVDTTINANSVQVDIKSTQQDWKVDTNLKMTPDCSLSEEKAKRPLNGDAAEFKPKSHCSGRHEQAANISYSERVKKSNISEQYEDYQERKRPESEMDHSHQQRTEEGARYGRRDGNDNYHKHKPGLDKSDHRSQSRQFVNSDRRGPKNDYPQEDSRSNYSNKTRWSQQNKTFNEEGRSRFSSNSRDGDFQGSKIKYQRESKLSFGKTDSTSTHNKHGNPEISVSQQNWDKAYDAQPSCQGYEDPQGAANSTSHIHNKAISNRQHGIENISKMNIRDVDNNSTNNIKLATPKEVLATPQNSRGSLDPRMKRETERKQQSNETSIKQRKPSPSPQAVDNSERTEEQNTSCQDDKYWDSQNVQNTEYKEGYDSWNDKTNKQNKSFPESIPKHETERNSLGGRIERSRKEDYDRSYEKTDVEYKEFNEKFRWNANFNYVKVIEKEQDLFEMSKDYSLGHCVAEDFRMGSGIAVTFKRLFKRLDDLLSQRTKQGGVAVLEDNNRYIYYLVTKRVSTGKPTYETFWSSLKKMRDHVVNHGVQKLAIPKIGCGLDRLEWAKVKYMIEFLFKDEDIEIVVCDFQQMEDTPQKYSLSTRLVYHYEPLKDIAQYTIILYFSTEDGHVSKDMEELDKKFNFLAGFRRSSKKIGFPIRQELKEYILYGCIVREELNKQFDFKSFAKCLFEIDKNNRRDKYEYVALQPVYDETDDLLNEKVITLLRNCLRKVDIYICSGSTPEEQ